MSVSVSTMTAYGLHRTQELGRRFLEGVPPDDFEKTGEATLRAVTQVTSEMAIISLVVCAACLLPAILMQHRDHHIPA